MINSGTFILADIDALLDTRLGTIALFDPETAKKVLRDKRYTTRLIDNFSTMIDHPDYNQEDYDATYQDRNEATLSFARPTSMVLALNKIFVAAYQEKINDPEHDEYVLSINMYPYNLDKEVKEDIVISLKEYLPDFVKMKYVWFSPTDLAPGMMKPLFTHWITYDIDTWTGTHFNKDMTLEELQKLQNPHLKIIAPVLLRKGEDYKNYQRYLEEAKEKHDIMKNPFLLSMFAFADTFELVLTPIEDFCCILR